MQNLGEEVALTWAKSFKVSGQRPERASKQRTANREVVAGNLGDLHTFFLTSRDQEANMMMSTKAAREVSKEGKKTEKVTECRNRRLHIILDGNDMYKMSQSSEKRRFKEQRCSWR